MTSPRRTSALAHVVCALAVVTAALSTPASAHRSSGADEPRSVIEFRTIDDGWGRGDLLVDARLRRIACDAGERCGEWVGLETSDRRGREVVLDEIWRRGARTDGRTFRASLRLYRDDFKRGRDYAIRLSAEDCVVGAEPRGCEFIIRREGGQLAWRYGRRYWHRARFIARTVATPAARLAPDTASNPDGYDYLRVLGNWAESYIDGTGASSTGSFAKRVPAPVLHRGYYADGTDAYVWTYRSERPCWWASEWWILFKGRATCQHTEVLLQVDPAESKELAIRPLGSLFTRADYMRTRRATLRAPWVPRAR